MPVNACYGRAKALMFSLFLALAPVVQAEVLNGYVVAIADGDTLTVLDTNKQQHKVRIAGIDAPERTQAFGDASKANLASLAFNKDVSVELSKLDQYQGLIGKVIIANQDVGLAQIKAGMAWWYRDYASEQSTQDQADYEQAEAMAKLRRFGLWRDKNPVPPWQWRRGLSSQFP